MIKVFGIEYVGKGVETIQGMIEAAKSNLIIYSGLAVEYAIQGNFKYIFHAEFGTRPVWVLPAGDSLPKILNDSFEVVQGERADGRKFWTSPVGLILKAEAGEIIKSNKVDGWNVPDADWLYDSLMNKQFLCTVPGIAPYIRYNTTAYKTELAEKRAIMEKEKKEKADALLRKAGVEPTEALSKLAMEVLNFDTYYDYSDDHAYCIRYRAYERDLRTQLEQAGVKDLLDLHIEMSTAKQS